MSRLYLFVFACVLCGLGGMLGSMAGNAFGERGVWLGGVIGGLIAAGLVAVVARGRQWIGPNAVTSTALGTAVGFVVAVVVTMNTMSSPVGPILSTTFAGIGALAGSALARKQLA
jgi:hypothetical protein